MFKLSHRTLVKTSFITLILIVIAQYFYVSAPKAYAVLEFEPVYEVLKNTSSGTGEQIKNIWQILMNTVNYFIIAILIFIAFAQILRLNVNTYGIKKILPALILAIIGANFSFLFCKLLIDLANVLIDFFVHSPDSDVLASKFQGTWSNPSEWTPALEDSDVGRILWFVVTQLFVIAGGIIVLILSYLFFIRIWLIYFLVALAPLAFMATVLPQTKSVFTQWMSNFAKWVFLPVVSIFWIWLGNQWMGSVKDDFMMTYVFAGVCYYLAITTPFKMGGAVMTAWGNLGKKIAGKPTGWALNKAKTKWVDPVIQDYKNRAMTWWHNQASGSQSKLAAYNPIGALARRALRKEDDRKDRADLVATSKEGAIRWAYGGKPISEKYDPKTGKVERKYKYFSDKGREKKALLMDSVKSDMGEYDYIRKHLDLHWKQNSEAGKLSIGRSVAYGQRVGGEENWHKALEQDVEALAYGDEEDNWFLNNTSFGIVAGDRHWKRQKDMFVQSQQKLERSTELISSKIKNDRIKFDYQPAATLTMLKEELSHLEKEMEKLTSKGIPIDPQLAADHDDAKSRYKAAIKEITSDETLFKNGKFTSNAITLKEMLTDHQGNFVGDDHTKSQSLVKLWGYDKAPDDLRELFISRLRKATSIIAKEEVSSEQGKRIAVESARRAIEKFESQLTQMFAGMPQGVWLNTHKDAFAALKNSLVNARDENAPEIYGKYIDLLKKISSSTDAGVTEEMKQSALKILANGQKQSMRTSLQQSAIMDGVLKSAAQEQLGMDDSAWKALGADGQAEKLSELRSSSIDFRRKVSEKFLHKANQISRQNLDELKQVLKIKYDEQGQVHVFVDTTDVALSSKVLGSMNGQAVNFNEREKSNSEGQQRLSTIAGLSAAMPTAEEAITFFEKKITAKGRAKERKLRAEEKAAFDAIDA